MNGTRMSLPRFGLLVVLTATCSCWVTQEGRPQTVPQGAGTAFPQRRVPPVEVGELRIPPAEVRELRVPPARVFELGIPSLEAARVPAPSLEEGTSAERIVGLVTGLEYPEKVGRDLVKMVSEWQNGQASPVLTVWKRRLTEARQKHTEGSVSDAQLAMTEESVIKELSRRIRKEISYSEKFFDLADVAKDKQAQCLGYSQLLYILGNSVNLSVGIIDVLELHSSEPLPSELTHVACTVSLADGKAMMVDLVPGGFVSKPFVAEEEFAKVGNYRELKNQDNPLGIHRRIQIWDRNGVIASVYENRGVASSKLGRFTEAISHHTRAIELNPKYAVAYNNRGCVYSDLGELTKAVSERTKAIELDPKFARAYYNRGLAYQKLGQVSQAISDYSKAIELNPKLAEAYNNRGAAHEVLGQHGRAISDYSKAIELDPKHAEAYENRGIAYYKSGQLTKAVSDHTKAIELNPGHAQAYHNRGNAYGTLGQLTKAISDFSKAIELNPKYAKAHYSRGVAQAVLGNFEEAKRDLLKGVQLDPSLKTQVKRASDHFKLDVRLE
jgi:tetratricopeptide (TPR) repeat protein